MAKSLALSRAEARIENMNSEVSDLKDMVGKLLLALAAKPAAVQPEAIVAPAKRVDDWLPRYDACSFSRPVIVVFDDADLAFEYRAQRALETGDVVAVKKCRAPDGYAIAAVY